MSWQEAVTAVNPPIYEDGHEGPPRINWFNGVAQARTGGVFYTKARHHSADLPAPWSLSQRFEDEEGYEAAAVFAAWQAVLRAPHVAPQPRLFTESERAA